MASLSRRREREEQRDDAMRSINAEAEIIALRRKAASWGANENEESISGFTGRWEALSNWFAAIVMWQGDFYPTVEHAFQAAKAAADPEAQAAIKKAGSPKEAHALGRKVQLPSDWERRKLKVMEGLLRDKVRAMLPCRSLSLLSCAALPRRASGACACEKLGRIRQAKAHATSYLAQRLRALACGCVCFCALWRLERVPTMPRSSVGTLRCASGCSVRSRRT